MEKIVDATYDGEVVRLDEPIDVAPNTKVRVMIDEPNRADEFKLVYAKKKPQGEQSSFLKFAGVIESGLPSDYSENLDDYLYRGKPLPDDK